MPRASVRSAVIVPFLLAAGPASAHLDIDYPAMRGGNQKAGPCEGLPASEGEVTVLKSGSVLNIEITETIGHPGHYRVMFDPDITDGEDFPQPVTCDDVGTPDGNTLLADNVLPAQGGTCPGFHTPSEREVQSGATYTIPVMLPDIECTDCALQVIQVMTDAGKADDDGNWVPTGGRGLYFRCANVELNANAEEQEEPDLGEEDPVVEDPGADDDSPGVMGGCSASASPGLPPLVFLAFALVRIRRFERSIANSP